MIIKFLYLIINFLFRQDRAILHTIFDKKKFLDLWKALLNLDSPFVVKFYDYHLENDSFYFIMEYAEHGTLWKVIKVYFYFFLYFLFFSLFNFIFIMLLVTLTTKESNSEKSYSGRSDLEICN